MNASTTPYVRTLHAFLSQSTIGRAALRLRRVNAVINAWISLSSSCDKLLLAKKPGRALFHAGIERVLAVNDTGFWPARARRPVLLPAKEALASMRPPCISLAVAALVMAARGAFAQAAADAQQAAADAIRRLDLQTDLPQGTEPDLGRFFSWHLHLPPIIGYIIWGAVFSAALYLFYLFIVHARGDLFARWRLAAKGGSAPNGEDTHRPQAATEAMMSADELARQGRFVEAMHTLLLQSLTDMRQRLDEQFADSLTSREILRNSRLPDSGRASLREIIARVEWTYFGHHPAGPADYQACREKFSELSQALHGGAGT